MKKAIIILGIIIVLMGLTLVVNQVFPSSYETGRDLSEEISKEFSDNLGFDRYLQFERVFDYYDRYSDDKDCLYRANLDSTSFYESFTDWNEMPLDLSYITSYGFNKRSKQFLGKFFSEGKYREVVEEENHRGRSTYLLAVYDTEEQMLYCYKLSC
ncbi:MAG: hypothetical protein IKR54_07745 [Lachnospiraceae bacterium]|jgi:hypothetical protein|nr:hypothetical protein [Lachnospiraceae bacterium]